MERAFSAVFRARFCKSAEELGPLSEESPEAWEADTASGDAEEPRRLLLILLPEVCLFVLNKCWDWERGGASDAASRCCGKEEEVTGGEDG